MQTGLRQVLALPVLLLLLATAHPVGDEPALPALSCRPATCTNGPLPPAHAAGVVWADAMAAAAAANGSQVWGSAALGIGARPHLNCRGAVY